MKSNIDIIRAEHMGFCFGVKKAVDEVNAVHAQAKIGNSPKQIYVLGMLVHNEFVIEKLLSKGVIFLSEEDVLSDNTSLRPGDTVIIRAHGTTKAVQEKLKEKDIKLIDMACVYVKSAREQVLLWEKKGYRSIFIGDKDHPEVKGITSYSKKPLIFGNLDELKNSDTDREFQWVFLFQTTYNRYVFEEIDKYITENFKNSKVIKTICGATHERQAAVENLAKTVDAVFIIGSHQSSNTKKLYQIAKKLNDKSYLIKDEKDINKEMLKGVKKAGITAGASTPEELIEIIEEKIKELV